MRATGSNGVRRRLTLGTALAGSLVLFAPGALAQATAGAAGQLPNNLNVNSNPQGATVTGGIGSATPTELNVGLNAKQSVIEWTHFDVPNGNSATFTDATGAGGKAAVLNRVTGFGGSSPTVSKINGAINSAPGVDVWLINPAGILVGATGAINTGGFVASTLDIADSDFLDGGSYRLSGADTGSILVYGGSIATTDGALVMVSPKLGVSGSLSAMGDTQSGDIALVAATDASFTLANGSPLSITITEGTTVASPMLVGGTVNGDNVYFAVATRGSVTDALLRVDAAVTANSAVVTDHGIVFAAGASASGVTVGGGPGDVSGSVGVRIGGLLNSSTDIVVRSVGTVTGLSNMGVMRAIDMASSAGNLQLTGIMAAGPGGVDLDAAAGTISVNSAGVGGHFNATAGGNVTVGTVEATDLTLRSTGGNVSLTSGKIGGPARIDAAGNARVGMLLAEAGSIDIDAGGGLLGFSPSLPTLAATGDVRVTAGGAVGAAVVDARGDAVIQGASINIGSLTATTGRIEATATTGNLALGGSTAGTSTALTADNGVLTLGPVLSGTDITVRGSRLTSGSFDSTGGAIDIETTGTATLSTALSRTGSVRLVGSAVSATGAGAATDLTVRSTAGDVSLAEGPVGGLLRIDAAGNARLGVLESTGGSIDIDAGAALTGIGAASPELRAAGDVFVTAVGAVGAALVQAGNDAIVDGGSINIDSLTATAGRIEATAATGNLKLGSSLAATSTALTADNGILTLGTVDSGTDITVRGARLASGSFDSTGGVVDIETTGAATLDTAVSRTGSVRLVGSTVSATTAQAATDLTVQSTAGGVALTSGTASGLARIDAADNARLGSLQSTGGSIDIDAGGGLLGFSPALPTLTAAGDVFVTAGGGVGAASIQAGNDAIVEGASINAGSVTATAGRVELTANGGTMALGTVGSGTDITVRGAQLASGAFDAAGAIDIETTGAATLSLARAGGSVRLVGSAVNAGTAEAATDLTVRSTAGDLSLAIGSAGGLLRVDSAGTAKLGTLNSSGGSINLDAVGGVTGVSALLPSLTAAGDVFVTAGGAVGAALIQAGNDAIVEGASINIDSLTATAGRVEATAATGNLVLGASTAGTSTVLTADNGILALGAIGSGTDITVRGARLASGAFDSTGGAVDIETTGTATLGTARAGGGSVRLVGSAVSATGAEAATDLTVQSTAGDVTLGSGTAAGLARVDAAGNARLGTLESTGGSIDIDAGGSLLGIGGALPGLTAAGDAFVTVGGAVRAASILAGNDAIVDGGSIDVGNLTAMAGRIEATATTGNLALGGSSAGTSTTLTANNGTLTLGTIGSGTDITVRGARLSSGSFEATGGAVDIETTGTATLGTAIAGGGSVRIVGSAVSATTAQAATDLTVRSTAGDVALTGGTADGLVRIDAAGNARLGALESVNGSIDIDAGGALAGFSPGLPSLSAAGDVLVTVAGAVGASEMSAGNDVIVEGASINIGRVTATTGRVEATAATGNLTLGESTAGTSTLLTANNGTLTLGTITGSTDVTVRGARLASGSFEALGGAVDIETTGAATLDTAIAGGGSARIVGSAVNAGTARAATDLTVQSTAGDLILGSGTADGLVRIDAAGSTRLGELTATNGAIDIDAGGALTGPSADLPIFRAAGDISVTTGGLSRMAVIDAGGAVEVRSDSIAIGEADAGTTLLLDAAGSLSLGTGRSGGSATLLAGGALSLPGALDVGSDLTIRGASVSLGVDDDAEEIRANGRIDVTGTNGSIRGGAGLALTANADGVGGDALILDATGGSILFDATSLLGSATAPIGIRVATPGSRLQLGRVTALSLQGADAAHALLPTLSVPGPITLAGPTFVSNGLSIVSTGGAVSLGDVTVANAGQGISVSTLGGGSTITGGTLRAPGSISLTAAGQAAAGTIVSSNGAIAVSGTRVSLGSADAATGLALSAGAGDVQLDTGVSRGAAALDASGAIRVGTLDTTNDATLDAGASILIGTLTTSSGTIDAVAGGGLTATTLDAGGATSDLLVEAGAGVTIGTASAGRAIDIDAASISVGEASADAATIAMTAAGNLSVGRATSGGAATLIAGGTVTLPGDVTAGTVSGGSALTVRGARVALGGNAGAKTIAASGAVDITATNGDITGGDGLTLRSNADGLGAESLILDATGGSIRFAPTTLLAGGTNRQSDIGIRVATAGGVVTLGTVEARGLLGAAADHAAPLPGTLQTAGRITVTGPITVTNTLSLATSAGVIDLTTVDVRGAGQGVSLVASGAISADSVTAPGAIGIDAGGAATIDTVASSAAGVSVSGRSVAIDTAQAATALALASDSGALSLRTGSAGTTATLDANGGGVNLDSLTTANGSIAITTDAGLDAFADAGRVTSIVAGGAGSDVSIAGAGTARLDTVRAADAVTVSVGTIDATSLTATGGPLSLTATAGGARVDTAMSGGAMSVGTAGAAGIDVGTATAGAGASFTAGGSGGIVVRTVTVTGDAALTTSGTGNVTVGSAVAGTGLGATGRVDIDAGGTATLHAVSAGTTLAIAARDADIQGVQSATDIVVRAGRLGTGNIVLGDAAEGNPFGTAGAAFRLSDAEFGRLRATGGLTVGTDRGNIEIGNLRVAPVNGAQSVSLLAPGAIVVRGTFDAADSGAARRFLFGGTGGGASKAQTIRIVALGNQGGQADDGRNGGNLQLGSAGVTLSADRIVAGQAGVFLNDVDSLGTDGIRLNALLIANPSSTLYDATKFGQGTTETGTAYADGFRLLSAGEVVVNFTNYALFQNTGAARQYTGVDIGTRLELNGIDNAIGTSVFAMYGTITGVGGVQTSLLGGGALDVAETDPSATRINGCLIGGAGCIVTDISQPILNVFDTSRVDILKTPERLQLPFDPLVGTNNESLFTGVGAIDIPVEEGECATRDKDGKCVPAGGDR